MKKQILTACRWYLVVTGVMAINIGLIHLFFMFVEERPDPRTAAGNIQKELLTIDGHLQEGLHTNLRQHIPCFPTYAL